MRDMPGDVVAQELHPPREVTVHCARELRLCSIPLLPGLERDVRSRVVHDGEGRHPEVVTQPRHKPVLHDAKPAKVGHKEWEGYGSKCSAAQPGGNHSGHLLLSELVRVKMPDNPVEDGCKQFQGGTQETLGDLACKSSSCDGHGFRGSDVYALCSLDVV